MIKALLTIVILMLITGQAYAADLLLDTAKDISVDAGSFNGALDATCTDVQSALNKLDDLPTDNWDTAYGWGDHAGLYSLLSHNHDGVYEYPLFFSTGLTRAVNTITNNLSTGVAGGQTLIGGTASGNNLTLQSTSHATKGKILFGASAYDEVNNRLGVGTASPGAALDVRGDAVFNEDGGNFGFRIESDVNANAFSMAGANGAIGIGQVPNAQYAMGITTNKRYGLGFTQTFTSGVYPFVFNGALTTEVATQGTGMSFNVISQGATAPSDNLVGMSFLVQQRRAFDTTGIQTSGINTSVYMEPNTNTDFAHGDLLGGSFAVGLGYSSAGIGVQTVTNAAGIRAGLHKNSGAGKLTITNWASFHAPADVGWSGSGTFTITNAAGIKVDKQTRGINNLGIWLNGAGLGADLVLGAGKNAKIYYDGTDLIVDPDVVGTGKVKANGSLQATDYYSGDGSQGITNTTGYWLCTNATCLTTCQVQIKDGLITGCL